MGAEAGEPSLAPLSLESSAEKNGEGKLVPDGSLRPVVSVGSGREAQRVARNGKRR